MRHFLTVLSIFAIVSVSAHAAEPAQGREQAVAARRILDAWHADRPEPGERFLHLVCWTPSDRELPANCQARLTRIMRHIQDFYAGERQRHGFGDRTIRLRFDDKQQLVLHTVRGLHATEHYGPAGSSDSNATTATTVPDAAGRFALKSEAMTPGRRGELRLFPLHANGSAADQMSQTKFQLN